MKSESGTLEMNVSSTQQQWLSDIVSKPIELEVYSENFLVSAFSLDGSMLKTTLFPPFCEFSMTNKSSNRMTATLAVEIVQPSRSNPSTTRKNENLIPIAIIDSSLPLPRFSLSLSLSEEGYSIYRNHIQLLSIPLSTIETSVVQDQQVVELHFNRDHCVWSHWIKMKVMCCEDSPIWSVLERTPSLVHHKPYLYVYVFGVSLCRNVELMELKELRLGLSYKGGWIILSMKTQIQDDLQQRFQKTLQLRYIMMVI